MSTSSPPLDVVIAKALAGLAGAVVSLRFVKGSVFEKILMVIGGAALSFFGSPWVTTYMHMESAESLVGFLMGLFGMAIVAKVYDAIQAADVSRIANSILDRISGSKSKES